MAGTIKKVETGSIHPVYLEGDATWTIEARMKHYHVPGLSRKDSIYFGQSGWDEGFSSNMVAHKTNGYGVLTNFNHPEFISELIFKLRSKNG